MPSILSNMKHKTKGKPELSHCSWMPMLTNMSRGCHLATITFTFDPRAPKFDQFVQFESKRIFMANLKKFPQWNVIEPH